MELFDSDVVDHRGGGARPRDRLGGFTFGYARGASYLGHDPAACAEKAKAGGATDAQLAAARGFQKKAQFLVDFIEAENSMGFHAPQEAARVLVKSVDYSRQGQVALRGGTTIAPTPAVAASP